MSTTGTMSVDRGRSRSTGRCGPWVVAALLVVVLAGACTPRSTRTAYQGQLGGQRLNVLGHSIPTSARAELGTRLGRTRQVAFDTADGRTIDQASASIDWAIGEGGVVVLAFGANELSGGLSQAELQRQALHTLDRLAGAPCVVWVDIRDRAHPFYGVHWQARAEVFNRWLAVEVGTRPNANAAGWAAWARPHEDWFVADRLHLSAGGRTAYAAFIAGSVDTFCGGITATSPATSEMPDSR